MKVYAGIGSNIGDKRANFEKAISSLNNDREIEIIRVSSFYETEPVGGPLQEDYLNGVIELRTGLSARELLRRFKKIEHEMGRVDTGKDHPRVIDLDILLYGDECINEDGLQIPHPRMHERSFVLEGMVEIAPLEIHPVTGKTMKEILCGL